jgi:RHS repeat-associated protein
MAETKTRDAGAAVAPTTTRWRFQLDNHLGSATLELDLAGNVISYEEYHPYGSTAFHTADGNAEVSAKRYRYTGKEKDDETGLYYHGARYYAAWLGRWTAADPLGLRKPGRPDLNLYGAVNGAPTVAVDPTGTESIFIVDRRAVTPRSAADIKADDRSKKKEQAVPPPPAQKEQKSEPSESTSTKNPSVTQAERLLSYVESDEFDATKYVSSDKKGHGYSAEQIKNILRVYLRAFIELENRGANGSNAALVAAQLGETGYGTTGPNAPILNWFSVQPSYPGTKDKSMIARREAFTRRGAVISSGSRAEKERKSPTVDNPNFRVLGMKRGLDTMVAAQFEIVYGLSEKSNDKMVAMYPALGAVLLDKSATGERFAAAAQRGYGPNYAKEFPSWYAGMRSLLARVLEPVARGLDADAAAWAAQSVRDLPAVR